MLSDIRSTRARLYILSVTLVGITLIAYNAWETFQVPGKQWIILAAMTGLASLFPVYLPRKKGKDQSLILTVSSIFTFTAILVYGPAVATMCSAVETLVTVWKSRTSMTLSKMLFNLAILPTVTFVSAWAFYLAYGHSVPLDANENHNLTAVFFLLGSCGFLYFLLNTLGITLVISLATGNPFRQIWRQAFLSGALTNFAEASAAVVVFLNFHQKSLVALGIAMPTAIVIWYAYKMNLTRIHEAQMHVEKINELYHATIEALAMAVDAKDQVTHGHIHRVQAMALGLARYCGVNKEDDLQALRAASLLHDIGKLATPDYILNKPSSLTDAEMETMKAHAAVGAEILSSVPFPYPVIPLVRHHHEKWDGSGYPDGLSGTRIPLGARILSIVDCYDALRSDRPYRSALSREATLEYISSEAGKSYDPDIVVQLLKHISELEANLPGLGEHSDSLPKTLSIAPGIEPWTQKGLSNTVFHDIASAHREVQALHEISQAVGRLLNVSETLTLLGDRVGKLIPRDSCAIYLMSSNGQTMSPFYVDGKHSDQLAQMTSNVGEGVTGWVAANHRALLNVSPAPDFKSCRTLASVLKCCLAAPLMLDQNVVGVITLYSERPNAFRPDHLRILENISHYAATALNNAIIFEETKEDAYTDVLTGLPNLRYFRMFAEQELRRAERASYPVTLIMMDLDFFKKVNDELGHKTGDRVLIEISHVLRNQMRKSDTCIRYGGDEFVGILPGLDAKDTQPFIEKIQSAVDNHVILLSGGHSIQIGVSIGSATLPIDGTKLDQLLAFADAAMYRNKMERAQQRQQTAQLIPFSRRRHAELQGAQDHETKAILSK